LLLADFPDLDDFEDLWELEEDLPGWDDAVAVAAHVTSSETAAITSGWRIRRFKRKLDTSGEIYEFL
jgi:hypothetical protein